MAYFWLLCHVQLVREMCALIRQNVLLLQLQWASLDNKNIETGIMMMLTEKATLFIYFFKLSAVKVPVLQCLYPLEDNRSELEGKNPIHEFLINFVVTEKITFPLQ